MSRKDDELMNDLVELVQNDEDRPKRKFQKTSYKREEKRDSFPRNVEKYSRKSGKRNYSEE